MKFKIGLSFLGTTALFLFFQNASPYVQSHISPDKGEIVRQNGDWRFYDQVRRQDHEVKTQGGGSVPKNFYYRRYRKNFLWFETRNGNIHKDRSEIRIVGSDAPFDQVYYTSFKVYYPSWADTVPAGHWGLLWQCAQAGDYETPRSPPISIQFRDNKLALHTISNYYSRDRIRQTKTPLASFPRNRWVSVFMRYRLGQQGSFKVWINKRVVADQRIPIGYKDGVNPFTHIRSCSARFGIYKKASPGRFALLFDDVKVGTSYSSVKPTR